MIDITWEDVAMKNILFFGDSNTYGYKPDKSGRYDYDVLLKRGFVEEQLYFQML